MEKRTFYELLEAYRKTAIAQSKQTNPGLLLCGGDILDDLADEMKAAASAESKAEGAAEERERIRAACREFKAGDTLVINVPTLLLESSVLHPKKHRLTA